MLRWSETQQGYRARLIRSKTLVLLLGSSALSCAAAVGSANYRWIGDREVALTAFFLGLALVQGLFVVHLWTKAPWIEFPLQGGAATWGAGSAVEAQTSSPVTRFDIVEVQGQSTQFCLVATCANDGNRVPMSAWSVESPAVLASAVIELNQHMGVGAPDSLDLQRLVVEHRRKQTSVALQGFAIVFVLVALFLCGLGSLLGRLLDFLD